MRRLVLVFLMCLLPLQWGWAAAASVCAHERDQAHFGHHEHRHASPADIAEDTAAGHGDEQPPTFHPDCHACHGVGAAFMPAPLVAGHVSTGDEPASPYRRHLPEPPIEALLRPPLPLVA